MGGGAAIAAGGMLPIACPGAGTNPGGFIDGGGAEGERMGGMGMGAVVVWPGGGGGTGAVLGTPDAGPEAPGGGGGAEADLSVNMPGGAGGALA